MIYEISISFLIFLAYIFWKIVLEIYIKVQLRISQSPECLKSQFFPLVGGLRQALQNTKLYKHPSIGATKLLEKYPKTKAIVTNALHYPVWVIMDPKLTKYFMNNQQNFKKFNIFLDRKSVFNGLLFVDGKYASYTRQLMGKVFNFDNIKKNYRVILNITMNVINQLKQECNQGKKTLNVVTWCQIITSKVITSSFFSQDIADVKIIGNSFENDLVKLFAENVKCYMSIKYKLKQFLFGQTFADTYLFKDEKENLNKFKKYFDFIDGIIQKRMNSPKKAQSDLLDIFLDYMKNPDIEGFKIDMDFIKQNFMTLVIAGIDTSSHVAGMCLYNIATNKKVYERIQKELGNLDLNNDSDMDTLFQNQFLNNVINETLRIHSPATGVIQREALKDIQIEDITVKKGDLVTVNLFALSTNPNVFKDSLEFQPDRWDSLKNIDPFQHIPFSAGSRNCIGQHLGMSEVKIIIATFIQNFEFQLIPGKELVMQINFTIGPKDDELIQIQAK